MISEFLFILEFVVTSITRLLRICLVFPILLSISKAADYYVDPERGSMTNPGTPDQPWSTLEAVIKAKKKFIAGDNIILRDGYHGRVSIVDYENTGPVTIKPDGAVVPKLSRLYFQTSSNWTITGLDICPEHAGNGTYELGRIVESHPSCRNITIDKCVISGAKDTTGWTEAEWEGRMGIAIRMRGKFSKVTNNNLKNVGHGIEIHREASDSIVSKNVIKDFCHDGLRGLASNCIFEDNIVMNCHTNGGNHDDGFQSWSSDSSGVSGKGIISNVIVRRNKFISWTSKEQPFKSQMQGIGLFDGMFENWTIENNLIVTDDHHGISIYGAINCKIVNNTVVRHPIEVFSKEPWIYIANHKDKRPSSNNIIRNNIAPSIKLTPGSGVESNNVIIKNYSEGWFVDYAGLNFTLSPASPALGKGTIEDAPQDDLLMKPRMRPYEAGAYEAYSPENPSNLRIQTQ